MEFKAMDADDFMSYAGVAYGDMIHYTDTAAILITRNEADLFEVHVDILSEDMEKQSYWVSFESYETPAQAIEWVNAQTFPWNEGGVQGSNSFECILGEYYNV